MAEFAETGRVLSKHYAVLSELPGEHDTHRHRLGMDAAASGFEDYDGSIHDPELIDPFAPMTILMEGQGFDQDLVREVDDEKALAIQLALDFTPREESKEATVRKRRTALSVASLLHGALPFAGDELLPTTVGMQTLPRGLRLPNPTKVVTTNRAKFGNIVLDRAESGLTTVAIGDFRRMELSKQPYGRTIAVVVNDVTERRVLQGENQAESLGGEYELHTGDAEQVAAYNDFLQVEHNRVVAGLERAGAQVVSIVTDQRFAEGYDVGETDRQIAGALQAIAKKA